MTEPGERSWRDMPLISKVAAVVGAVVGALILLALLALVLKGIASGWLWLWQRA